MIASIPFGKASRMAKKMLNRSNMKVTEAIQKKSAQRILGGVVGTGGVVYTSSK